MTVTAGSLPPPEMVELRKKQDIGTGAKLSPSRSVLLPNELLSRTDMSLQLLPWNDT
jgi:hypothetical protein